MAKITDRQKLNILAKWDTGAYTKTELAKTYKVSESNIRKIIDNREPKNADIVEAQYSLEKFKKCEKSATENQAIDKVVKEKLKEYQDKEKLRENVFNSQLKVLEKINFALNNHKPMEKVGLGNGIQELKEVEYGSGDYKNFADAIDKVAVTLEVAPRHAPKQDINLTNAQQNIEAPVVIFQRIENKPNN